MKERIFSLEEEIKHKNCLISNLVNKLCTERFVSTRIDKKHDKIDTKNDKFDMIPPGDTNIITPEICSEDKDTIIDEVYDSFQEQLVEVRKIKHSNYIENKKVKKNKEKTVLVVGDSMVNGIKEKAYQKITTKLK